MEVRALIRRIDHLVITTPDIDTCIAFYEKLGFTHAIHGGRHTLIAGDFKINVHQMGREPFPHAGYVQVGSGDFCFETLEPVEQVRRQLEERGITVELGIVERVGAKGPMRSLYLRDPDGNLIELSSYARE